MSTQPDDYCSDALNPASLPCCSCELQKLQTPSTRRAFFARAATTLGVVLVGGALPGCLDSGDSQKPATGTASAPSEPIQAKTEGANVRVPGGGNLKPNTAIAFSYGPEKNPKPGIVFATTSGQLRALSARCTHAGCAVNWSDEGNPHLHCPCHGSNFDLTGKVLQGPAKAPLASFAVQKSGADAVVKIAN